MSLDGRDAIRLDPWTSIRLWLGRSLREQLELLAAPGARTLARLPDGCVKADELALDFDNFYQAYVSNLGAELSAAGLQALREVDELLAEMSGDQNAELWTEDAVLRHPAWEEVRRRAARALELVQQLALGR